MLKSRRARIAAFAVLATFLLGCAAAIESHDRHRQQFLKQVDDTSNDIAEVIDKLRSDQVVFDLADDRAVVSIQKLRDAAYTDRQRKGADELGVELGTLRACRGAIGLPGGQFSECLDSTDKINKDAFNNLGVH